VLRRRATQVDGNQLCGLGHARQIVLFYIALAAMSQCQYDLDI